MEKQFNEKYKFPSIEYVNGSKENTYPAKAMIMCFEQLTKSIHELTIEVKRIADKIDNNGKEH